PGIGLLEDRDDLGLGELRLLHGTSWLGKHARKFYFCGVCRSGKLTAVLAALEDGDNDLPMALRHTLAEQLERIAGLEREMAAIEDRLQEFARRDVTTQRYQQVPGIGLMTATALRASAGSLDRFRSGRHLSAWLGLVPREHSSGTHRRLGRITRRGDTYLRTLLIHGARAVLQAARMKQRRGQALDPLQVWALDLQQ